jgi:hypothetical protein
MARDVAEPGRQRVASSDGAVYSRARQPRDGAHRQATGGGTLHRRTDERQDLPAPEIGVGTGAPSQPQPHRAPQDTRPMSVDGDELSFAGRARGRAKHERRVHAQHARLTEQHALDVRPQRFVVADRNGAPVVGVPRDASKAVSRAKSRAGVVREDPS